MSAESTSRLPPPASAWRHWVALVCRWIVGGLFVYTGAIKAWDPGEFVIAVRSYQLVGDPWAAIVALGLPWLEIFGGLALVTGLARRGGALIVGGGLVFFIAVLSVSWARGLDIDCGCFGRSDNHTNYPAHLMLNVVLLAALAVGMRWDRRGS